MLSKQGKYIKEYEVTSKLKQIVLARISQAEIKQARFESVFSYFFVVISSIASVGAFWWIYQDATQTGLLNSLSLLFTDSGAVLSYWKEFLLSVTESLPVVSLVAVFVSLFILIFATGNLSVVRQNKLKLSFSN